MIIQSIMIFFLGAFIAVLIAIAIAPLIWARASIVTRQQIVSTLPLNEFEIRASRDHLRAEHAIKAHRLESKLEQAEQVNARQLIEINRRELQIHEINNQIIELKQEIAEKNSQNIVLLQNIDRKVPALEDRAERLMAVLIEREREMDALKRHGIHSFSHDNEDDDDFYYSTEEIEQMREELGEEVEMSPAPRRTIIENAESIHEENRDLLKKVAKLQARVMKLEGRESNETNLLRAEMQNIAITLMQEQAEAYRSQFHNLPNLTGVTVDPANQLPFEFEFDEKKPVFIEKAELAAAKKAANPTKSEDDEPPIPENSLTARLETLLKQK
ncbi:MAG: hypothetical protein DHS20C08_13320 [Rhodomicrobium sp.]|jgi:chromosome segregation ATPase|nr:MAG: hypothetical protein DHS20C08_13320 [Rhodomicrobium sp.]